MPDYLPQNKFVFWGILCLMLAFTMIPSLALMDASKRYFRFLLEWNPGTLPMTRTQRLPHRSNGDSQPPASKIFFIQFKLAAPKARQVLIAGDFNEWRPEALSRSFEKKGQWEILLPLPAGRYPYAYQVDGVWTKDPSSRLTLQKGDIQASIREVP